jgi:polyketide synthase PksN
MPVREGQQIYTALFAQGDDRLAYEIYGSAEGDADESVHCQGQAVLRAQSAPGRLDIEHLKSQMRQGKRSSPSQYECLAETGVNYGPAYRGITSVYVGDRQVLAELSIPSAAVGDPIAVNDELVLHPILIDSALQAAFDLLSPATQPSWPSALESLRLLSASTNEMFAWVRYSQGGKAQPGAIQLDVDLCDRHGNVCIEMRGVTYEQESLSDVTAMFESTTSSRSSSEACPVALEDDAVAAGEPRSKALTFSAARKPTAISLVGTN